MKIISSLEPLDIEKDGYASQIISPGTGIVIEDNKTPVPVKTSDKPDPATQYHVRLKCSNCGYGRFGGSRLFAVEDIGVVCDPSGDKCPNCGTMSLVKDV